MEKKKLNKTTKSNLITYGMVLAAYLIVQGMIAGNLLSNLMQGLLVPAKNPFFSPVSTPGHRNG